MDAFTKTIRPFTTPTHNGGAVSVFCKIKLDAKGRLSITGVEGPKRNGDCYGGAGQIIMHDWDILALAEGWTPEMVSQFRDTWERWHLNDMRAYSPEMRAAGWHEKALAPMLGYEFTRTREWSDAHRAAEKAAIEAARAGETFTPTPEQVDALSRPYSVTIWTAEGDSEPAAPDGMERARNIGGHASGNVKAPERKTLGWLKPSEHPDGLLGRKLNPDDSHGYGGKWWAEAVPADVLEWLKALPDADKTPAWV